MDSINFNTDNMGGILHHIKRGDPNDAGVDISKLFKKKTGEEQPSPIQQFDEKDVKELEDFCKKMGILGFNTSLNPRDALKMLKCKMGIIQSKEHINEENKKILYG